MLSTEAVSCHSGFSRQQRSAGITRESAGQSAVSICVFSTSMSTGLLTDIRVALVTLCCVCGFYRIEMSSGDTQALVQQEAVRPNFLSTRGFHILLSHLLSLLFRYIHQHTWHCLVLWKRICLCALIFIDYVVRTYADLRSALIGQGSSRLSYAHICQRKSPSLPSQPPPSADHTLFYPGHKSTQATAPPLTGGTDA